MVELATLHFDALRDIVALFLVAPDQLPSVLAQGNLSLIGRAVLLELVRCRADYSRKAAWVKRDFPELLADGGGGAVSRMARTGRARFGRAGFARFRGAGGGSSGNTDAPATTGSRRRLW